MADVTLGPPDRVTPLPGALLTFGVAGIGLITAVLTALNWEGGALALVMALYAAASMLTVQALAGHGPRPFGWANVVTTFRLAATCFVAAALITAARDLDTGPVWIAIGVTLVALALDGIDGFLARRSGLCSPFGARFDMEVDAALILLLSVAAWELGKAGGWIVAIGAMRYVFVAAQAVIPKLRAPLPPSFLRKAVCVVQVSALCIAVTPVVPPAISAPLAGIALVALSWSFLRDTVYLLRGGDQAF
ncbi:CDP-alcohol phosphatidyltransferase family protein [Falsirhodobacter halotolerans]|uniref:CDP-alcohol phosphatidyltransferase family protein n=1 Tax=Falsirhodobacter halotolerans TaxID=1146892 RepID=UPI001FD21767|nr:CDP-alcohol phosphatidyltransferase family protein [Falsirhodobacter halotolerans]MCJ8139991.1 CDP-alcohol phosphatidyltransferase family protein [Falsirhodobacter halotolerans]